MNSIRSRSSPAPTSTLKLPRLSPTEYSIPRVSSVEELLNDGDIEIILNLTIPAAHTEVNRLALDHGKHAYCEKPFGLERDVARAGLNLAREKNLRVGCAPATSTISG